MGEVRQRNHLTEEEHEQFVELGNKFYDDLSKIVADALNACPRDLHDYLLTYLSDRSSVYGSNYENYIK